MNYTKEQALEVYACVRKDNHSIPDDALDSMKATLLVAPDLLKALQVIVDNGGIGPEQMFRDARAAIAQALGK